MITLGDAIEEWLKTVKQNSVKPTTYLRLEVSLGALRENPIGDILLKDLTKRHLQCYINDLVSEDYAYTTIKKQYGIVRAYLAYAVSEGVFPRPIYDGVKLPSQSRIRKKRREVHGYDANEQCRLRAVLARREHTCWAMIDFLIETGLRIGEAMALSWDDILWEKRAVKIHKTVIRVGDTNVWNVQDEPKSFSSNRVIPLSVHAIEIITELFKESKTKEGFIFPGRNGGPLTYESARYHGAKVCSEANVPYMGLHAFRHTFATNCYHRGCDVKILSKLLGHADVGITYNIYIHLYGDALEEMRAVVG